jgi:hypothetical protein
MGKRHQEDSKKAKAHVYASKGAGPCPYGPETRAARLWEKWRVFYLNMESQFDDLAQAYGEFRPDRLHSKEPTDGL